MTKAQKIYNYKPPKSGNDEVSYFLTKGRITRRAFFLRLLLVITLFSTFYAIKHYYIEPQHQYWEKRGGGVIRNETFLTTYSLFNIFNNIVLPITLGLFLFIQGTKRMHDTNNSGWNFFVPIYNVVLLFLSGTRGQNKYGVDPKPQKVVKYFDQLEAN